MKLDVKKIKRVMVLRGKGLSFRKIAKRMDTYERSVYRWWEYGAGIKMPGKVGRPKK